jgi:SAM-dependent methyltransferase
MNDSSDFWNRRLIKHGHTGWADQAIYAYDQQERLALVEAAITKLPIQRGSALDFGCGTGDFSKLLLSSGFNVCGYDPNVHPMINSARFTYANSFQQIELTGLSKDLALTITTLDHILDELELLTTLSKIRAFLKPAASFLMLEYALDSPTDRKKFRMEKNSYQSFRLLSEWLELLSKSYFSVEQVLPMPHPIISPSFGYATYSRNYLARIRRRFSDLPLARFWCDPVLKWYANTLVKQPLTALGPHPGSPLKLIHSRAV